MSYNNGTSFLFLNTVDIQSSEIVDKVNAILKAEKELKPYQLNWKDIQKQYHELGGGDIDEFSFNYVFGYHAIHRKLGNRTSKEAMYLEVRSYLLDFKLAKGII